MATFKKLYGDESNISLDITPFHEGWVYITTSGYYYVDLNIGTAESPNNQRIKLNAHNAETLMGKSLDEIKQSISWNDLLDKPTIPSADGFATNEYVDDIASTKVDKVSGKGLSTNDYTTTEKNKLSGISSGAEVNQNAFSNVIVGSTTIAADSTTDSLTIAAGTGISVAGDATNDKVTITNSGVRSISTGSSNGTISVNTNGTSADVAVKGLGSAAYTNSSAYDAAGTAQTKADSALSSAKSYTDTKISNLINSAPSTLDTLGEIATAMEENADVVEALEAAIGTKANASDLTAHTSNKSNPHGVTKSQVGLGNVENKSSATIRGEITKSNVTTALGYTPYTPTEVDTKLSGKANSEHGTHVSYSSTNPVMDGTASVGSASTVARSDHKHPTDTSRASKTEFDTHTSNTTAHITSTERSNWNAAKSHADSAHAPSNAEKNQNAFSNITVGSTTIAADTATDTVTFVGSNVTITPDATNDKITFSVADASTSAKGLVQLTNSTSSTSTTTAATPNSVKSAYDLANTAKTNAATAQATADSKANASHNHSAANITSGTLSSDRLPSAGSSLGGVKSGGDVTISSGVISVNDDSHNHTILTKKPDNFKISTDLPSTYPIGETVFFSTQASAKFKGLTYCTVHTIKTWSTASCMQFVYPYNTDQDTIFYRHSLSDKDVWGDWQTIATKSEATTSAAGLMSARDKKRVDSFAGSYNLGKMAGKTKAEFQTALDTWLTSYSNVSNASAYFIGDSNWISVWNSSDTTKTISDGGIWTVTIIAKYDTKNYTQLRMSSYYDKQVVYVARTGGVWLTAHVAAFKDDLPSAAGSSLGLVKSGGDVTISSGVITVNDDSHNHVISNVDGLQGALDGKVKGDYKAATTAATAGWYRIATTPVGISNCIGIFEIAAAVSGRHTTAIITAGTSYGNPDSSTIHVLHCSQYSGNAITKARIVYYSTYASNYAYVEVYNPSATAMSLSVRLIGGTNWGLVAPNTAGSVPSGYSSKEVTLSNGTMVAGTFAGALSGNAATATKLTTSAGSATQPVYFSDGKPVATTYTLGKSVPSDAKFTDTTYSAATTSTAGLMTAAMVTKLNGITEGADSVSFTQSATSGNKVGEITINGTKTAMYSPTQTSVSGNAGTATTFASAQSVALTGDVTGSASSKAGWSIATTLANSGVTAGSYGPSANASPAHGKTFSVPYITVDAKGRVTSASTKTITLPTYSNATTSAAGLMSSTDKSRLDQCYTIITNNLNEVAF